MANLGKVLCVLWKLCILPVLGEVVYEYPQLRWLKRSLLKLPSPSLISCTSSHTQAWPLHRWRLWGSLCRARSPPSPACLAPSQAFLSPSDPLLSKFQSPHLPWILSSESPRLWARPGCPSRQWAGGLSVCFLALRNHTLPLPAFLMPQKYCLIFYLFLSCLKWEGEFSACEQHYSWDRNVRDSYIVLECYILAFSFKNQQRTKRRRFLYNFRLNWTPQTSAT